MCPTVNRKNDKFHLHSQMSNFTKICSSAQTVIWRHTKRHNECKRHIFADVYSKHATKWSDSAWRCRRATATTLAVDLSRTSELVVVNEAFWTTGGWESSVNIVTRVQATLLTYTGSIPEKAREFFSSALNPDWYWGPLNLLFRSTIRYFSPQTNAT